LARRGAAPRRAVPVERGHPLERARWERFGRDRLDASTPGGDPDRFEPASGGIPWRRVEPPAPVRNGALTLAGRRRRVLRLSRVERATPGWWDAAAPEEHVVELLAWAELEGPVLALLRAAFADGAEDRWEAVAYLD
ncbi:MAG: hypothetical protein AAGH15_26670, partial [Myxococcota bacterium]